MEGEKEKSSEDFRTENEFGIYRTERGWAIVVNLKVTMGSR